VTSVDIVDVSGISDADAALSGHPSAEDIRSQLRGAPEWPVYRVEFRLLDEPDPREVLANASDLSVGDIADLDRRLDRLDKASRHGPWTAQTLRLIAERPATRAPDLAQAVGRDTQPFKLDVRKLKNLGLTISLNPGYRLSPRGQAYIATLAEEKQ